MKPMELAPTHDQRFRVIGPYAEDPGGRLTAEGRALAERFAGAYRPLRKLAYKKLPGLANRFAYEHGADALEALCGEAVIHAVRRFQPGRRGKGGRPTRALCTVVVVAMRGTLSEHYRPRAPGSRVAAVWTNQHAAHADHKDGLEADLFARLAAPEPEPEGPGVELARVAWARLRDRAMRQRNPGKRLTRREWQAVRLRFADGLSTAEVGRALTPPVTKERARQIAASGLAKLQAVAARTNRPLTLPR
jgi:hypothetical protein